ncbi:MAG: DUF4249 domain-containing protein [Bacteroidota bacterium]
MKCLLHMAGLALLGMLSRSCVEPYYPDIEAYENLLVVDGLLTNGQDPCLVRLSRTSAYDGFQNVPVTEAVVAILDDLGTVFSLEEGLPGQYLTDPARFTGVPGRSYQIHIVLSDGSAYESDFMLLRDVPPVEALEARYERREMEESGTYCDGIQIYLNTSDPSRLTRYYRWEWEETWEFTVPMQAPEKAELFRCWKSGSSRSIMIGTSEQLTEDRIIDFPLHYVEAGSNRLRILYSLLVRQYAESPAAYDFWKMQKDMSERGGTLFDPIPAAIPGNIYSLSDPDEMVLGLFDASGVSTRRIFIDPELLPPQVDVPTDFEFCRFQVLQDASAADLNHLLSSGWIYVDEYDDMNHLVVRLTNHTSCFDCTRTGTNAKPEFWPDHEK